MSAATAPPTVTCPVPGVTGTKKPRGTSERSNASMVTAPPAVTTPVDSSTTIDGALAVMSSTTPPAFWAASPYERPSPRAITPRTGGERNTAPVCSPSPAATTVAAVGAVRPHPISSERGTRSSNGGAQHDHGDPDRAQDGEGPVGQ